MLQHDVERGVREVEPLRVADAKFEAAPAAIAREAHVFAAHVDTDEAIG